MHVAIASGGFCTYGNELLGTTERDTFLSSSANISFSRWTQNGGRVCNNALIVSPAEYFMVVLQADGMVPITQIS